jgi:SAM-dependent methyltransferase
VGRSTASSRPNPSRGVDLEYHAPPRATEPVALAELRATLSAAGYTYEAVAGPARRDRFLAGTDADAAPELDERLAALVELFSLGHRLPTVQARAALRPMDLHKVSEMGLLTVNGEWATPGYRLRPYAHLLLAGEGARADDRNIVSAFTGPSLKVARLTPRAPVRSMLDVGTGSGVLALLGARHCDQVTAIDVNPRALTLARFNSRLNDISNLELLEGSWFEPVAGRAFDLIVSNPPYAVSPDREFAYRDSGMPGTSLLEQLTRQSAEHLAPGGLAVLLCNWPHESADDWDAAPATAVAGTGCDALIISSGTVDPFDYAVSWNAPPVRFDAPDALRQTVARWLRYYRATGVGAITNAVVILRRRTGGTPWVKALRAPGPAGERAAEQLTAVLAGHDLLQKVDDRALMAGRFALPEGVDVSQRFHRRSERFVARPAMVRLEAGLGLSAAVDPDALDVLFACDGQRTLSEAVQRVAGRRGKSDEVVGQMARTAVRELLTHGLLRGT